MATGAYDANGIWQYGEDDNIALFSDLLNLATESTSDAFTDDRARLATLEAGSLAGLIPVVPTTVTAVGGTATANSLGTITFTNCNSVRLDSVFTSEYANYKVVFYATKTGASASAKTYARLSAAGTPVATNYVSGYSGFSIGGTSLIAGGLQSTYFQFSELYYIGGFSSGWFDVLKPAIAAETQSTGMATVNTQTDNAVAISGSRHTLATVYDGLQFGITANTISGTINVYGYND